jgi:transcriptional regulator with XRE-family HTH domain
MAELLNAARLLRDARTRAGMSQRELAARAGTAQSVVARIEGGQTDPSLQTLVGLVGAAGFELVASVYPAAVTNSHMLDDVARILRLTPEQRLLEIRNISRFECAARRT